MEKHVEFLFEFGSPTSYFAYVRLMRVRANDDINIKWTPVLLGGLLQAVGNSAPTTLPVKEVWFFNDLRMWSEKLAIPFIQNPYFPINTLVLMRGAVAYQGTEKFEPYVQAIYEAFWAKGLDLGNIDVINQVLSSIGITAEEFKMRIGDSAVKQRLKANTEMAAERGVFGCPTFFVGSQMFFGQDRLDFVQDALNRFL